MHRLWFKSDGALVASAMDGRRQVGAGKEGLLHPTGGLHYEQAARPDRGELDKDDVINVLARQPKPDTRCLELRAQAAGVLATPRALRTRMRQAT